ncbi:von Willebrand factor A domain-containing protein 5A-like isoform X2 [Mercenaria mercenaria]|uniref:von Willebrand factor A domain-containing protein 5A-like isoform X2 n=1 Tax=Mercenaria mercenaria TaxID=6596 RepID=UPI00234F09BB|nr:von Willebrand factor A domain-containing protein 5A-like isoform X2 [Mercenaria mercenaria]
MPENTLKANDDKNAFRCLGLLSDNRRIVPLKSIKVDVHIIGYVAEVSSRLTYFNEEETPVEAVFTFPVDDGSAVFQFEADIDGRHIVAEIQEKEQAKLTYQDAINHGESAMLLKEDNSAGDIFSCMLGNLPPQSEASLVMKYVIELPQEADGRLRFTLPTILNPRYSPDVGGTVPAEGATYVPPCEIPYEFCMTATVEGYHKVISATSDRVTLDVKFEQNNRVAKVSLCDKFQFDHDLSFLVQYENAYSPHVVLERGNPEAEGLLKEDMLMVSFHPDLKEVSMATSGEYVFVIDRSGSMIGNKIKNAKEALLLFLKSLPPDCYFNIISFGSIFKPLFPIESQKYSTESLEEAIELEKSMEADMYGTEIQKPLTHVFNMAAIEGHPRRVFVLTDGEVDDIRWVTRLVKENTQNTDTRVFTLGIGDGVSTALVKGIASNGGGKAEIIDGEERIQSKVVSLLKCAMQPAITDVNIDWDLPSGVTLVSIPSEPPSSIYAGERLTLFTILKGLGSNSTAAGSLTLKGQQNGSPVSYRMTFTLCKEDEICESAPVHRLATKAQIKLLQDMEAEDILLLNPIEDAELRQKIVNFSRQGNIVSRYTAFVAIDTEGKKVSGELSQRSCPVPMVSTEYKDGMYDARLMKQGVTDPSQYSTAIRKTCVQHMKLTKRHCQLLDDDEDWCVKDGSRSGFGRKTGKNKGISCFNIKLPKFSKLFSKKRKSKEPVSCKKSVAEQMGAVGSSDSAQACSSTSGVTDVPEDKTETSKLPSDDAMLSVIALQQLHGRWELSDTLLTLLEVTMEDFGQLNFSDDPYVVCTVIVLCWLRKQFSHRQEEWQMIETKALAWLASHNLSPSEEDIIQQTTKSLWRD